MSRGLVILPKSVYKHLGPYLIAHAALPYVKSGNTFFIEIISSVATCGGGEKRGRKEEEEERGEADTALGL